MSLVIKFVVGMENAPQIDATNLFCGALLLQVALHTLNDGADLSLILQVLYILWQGECLSSARHSQSPVTQSIHYVFCTQKSTHCA